MLTWYNLWLAACIINPKILKVLTEINFQIGSDLEDIEQPGKDSNMDPCKCPATISGGAGQALNVPIKAKSIKTQPSEAIDEPAVMGPDEREAPVPEAKYKWVKVPLGLDTIPGSKMGSRNTWDNGRNTGDNSYRRAKRSLTRGNRLLHLSDGEFRDAADVANLQIENGGLHMSPKDMSGKLETNEQERVISFQDCFELQENWWAEYLEA